MLNHLDALLTHLGTGRWTVLHMIVLAYSSVLIVPHAFGGALLAPRLDFSCRAPAETTTTTTTTTNNNNNNFSLLHQATNSSSSLASFSTQTNGTVSLTVINVAMVVSCCFVPSLLIKLLKFKYTMALSMLACSTYIAAQFSSSLGSLVPTGIIFGLAAAPLWSAKCTYLTKAYVWCVLGVHRVGYVMICSGVCGALCSITVSPLVKVVGRTPLFTMGAVINVGVIITLIWWRPHRDDTATFFLLAGLWGVADAVWVTQMNAFHGVIFPGRAEAAFSNLRLWKSLGYIISSSTSSLLCMDAKIVLLLVFIVIGMAGYFLIEIMERFGGLKKDSDGNVVPIDKLVMDVVS